MGCMEHRVQNVGYGQVHFLGFLVRFDHRVHFVGGGRFYLLRLSVGVQNHLYSNHVFSVWLAWLVYPESWDLLWKKMIGRLCPTIHTHIQTGHTVFPASGKVLGIHVPSALSTQHWRLFLLPDRFSLDILCKGHNSEYWCSFESWHTALSPSAKDWNPVKHYLTLLQSSSFCAWIFPEILTFSFPSFSQNIDFCGLATVGPFRGLAALTGLSAPLLCV